MISFLYTLIIFPIVQLIELCYVFVFRVFHNPGMAIMGVSVAVSIFTLPLYIVAEKYQRKERDFQKRVKPKINKIKAVFSGDEQYMILSTYYKQNHYHPVYAMRNTFSLLIQIPFFIAAYSYLSHLGILHGASFLFIKNLGKPDALLNGINMLPVFMTLVNVISGSVYAKGMDAKNKIQLYGISLVFLVLLYNSPAGLVLYWTMNNIVSLAKNILQKTKHSKTIIFIIMYTTVAAVDVFLLFIHKGDLPNRLLAALLVSIAVIIPLIIKFAISIRSKLLIQMQPSGIIPPPPQFITKIRSIIFICFPALFFSCYMEELFHHRL